MASDTMKKAVGLYKTSSYTGCTNQPCAPYFTGNWVLHTREKHLDLSYTKKDQQELYTFKYKKAVGWVHCFDRFSQYCIIHTDPDNGKLYLEYYDLFINKEKEIAVLVLDKVPETDNQDPSTQP